MQSRQASTGTTSVGRSATVSSTNSSVAPTVKAAPTSSFAKKTMPPPPAMSSTASAPPPPYSSAGSPSSSVAGKKAPPAPPPLKPKPKSTPAPKIVVALYDFAAQAEGDLEFRAGDQIELVERSASSEDWWTGKLNGKQGVFPGEIVFLFVAIWPGLTARRKLRPGCLMCSHGIAVCRLRGILTLG